ncbi:MULTISPECIES: hypothetical protein [unclassified Mesorhizobium]|uniref:hypothetical protein n=1 Tax=unclassified Mesorhizobium TaxID=325217 RepID=UPI0007FE41B8|nr:MULTISPECIES: hypothetical protein [unclassified Mesorhizobium]MDG4899601.1 hypothetical protein [Mesorhizobium sp. WSM4962]MDG4890185.1 hypothetical protein [Mesorhizobium sp. WSM4887]MDG4905531.1 hypothetical protein [Mesorhizobium sp. WSM4898]OBQ77194.1 hypothetical protein A9K71_11745 [Mesorhizobium sp. WSM3873]OBQ94983.1 hypothetical protein A9K66_06295 [Mesorhizobium sp. AA23]
MVMLPVTIHVGKKELQPRTRNRKNIRAEHAHRRDAHLPDTGEVSIETAFLAAMANHQRLLAKRNKA